MTDSMSIVSLILNATLVVKFVMLTLFGLSVASWYVRRMNSTSGSGQVLI